MNTIMSFENSDSFVSCFVNLCGGVAIYFFLAIITLANSFSKILKNVFAVGIFALLQYDLYIENPKQSSSNLL